MSTTNSEPYTDFDIKKEDGFWRAKDDTLEILVMDPGTVKHRRAIKPFKNERRSALRAELNGVKLYVKETATGHALVLTEQDMRV